MHDGYRQKPSIKRGITKEPERERKCSRSPMQTERAPQKQSRPLTKHTQADSLQTWPEEVRAVIWIRRTKAPSPWNMLFCYGLSSSPYSLFRLHLHQSKPKLDFSRAKFHFSPFFSERAKNRPKGKEWKALAVKAIVWLKSKHKSCTMDW